MVRSSHGLPCQVVNRTNVVCMCFRCVAANQNFKSHTTMLGARAAELHTEKACAVCIHKFTLSCAHNIQQPGKWHLATCSRVFTTQAASFDIIQECPSRTSPSIEHRDVSHIRNAPHRQHRPGTHSQSVLAMFTAFGRCHLANMLRATRCRRWLPQL